MMTKQIFISKGYYYIINTPTFDGSFVS